MNLTDKWLFDTFVQKSDKGEYFFNTNDFSAAVGEIVNPETAAKGEAQILSNFLAHQINLM